MPIDKNLFIYLTKRAGFGMSDVADLWGVPLSGAYKRINGEIDLRRGEMESWMEMVGVRDAGPIFFPKFVADSQRSNLPSVEGSDGC